MQLSNLSNFQDGLLFLLEKYKIATLANEINNNSIQSQLDESEMKHKTLRELYIDKLMHDNLLLIAVDVNSFENTKMVQQLVKNKTVIDYIIKRREQLGQVVTMDPQVATIYEKCVNANKLLSEELLYWVPKDKINQVRESLSIIKDHDSLIDLFCKQCNTNSLDGFHKLVSILECIMMFSNFTQSA